MAATALKTKVEGLKRSLLFVFEYPTLNGGEYSWLSVSPKLRERFEVFAAAPETGPLREELRKQRVETFPLEIFDDHGQRHSREIIFAQLEGIVGQAEPDQIHANSLSMARLLGAWRAETKFAGKVTGHLRDIVKLSRAAVSDLNRLDQLAAVSHAVRDYHVKQKLPADKVKVVYNGVDLKRFRPQPVSHSLHAELGVPTHWSLVGAIGQIGMRKGVEYFVKAAQNASMMHEHSAYVYVGERHSQKDEAIEYEAQLRKVASSGSLAGRFFFLGRRNDVPTLMNQFTILVHSALQEPLGRVLLEAAAAHKPIVATDVGGTREIFANDQAILVRPKDSHALARSILMLLDNPKLREQLSERAGELAKSRFSLKSAGKAILEFFDAS